MLALKKVRLIIIGFSIISFTGAGCSLMKKPGPTEAEIAQQKMMEKKRAEKIAAEKKAAKEKQKQKAEQEEDTIELHQIKTIEEPPAEKLPDEPVSANKEPSATTEPASGSAAVIAVNKDEASTSATEKLEIPTEPNTYLVTVEQKNKTHPFYHQGDNRGFVLNGKQGQYVIAKRGEEIKFKVRTGVQHDFYLTTAPKGWGAAPYTPGVKGQFTYKGDVIFKPGKEAPTDLYYGCRNHNAMGGHIVVVDANADIAAIKAKLEEERKLAEKNAKSGANKGVDPQKVSQKIAYVGMLLQFKGKSLAPDQKAAIQAKLDTAKQQQKKGELAAALATAKEAGAMFNGSAKKSGPSKEEIAEQKEEINDLMITLEAFIDSHKASYEMTKKQAPEKLVDYDHDVVEKLVTDAVALTSKNQFGPAKRRIKEAERLVTKALNDMLNSQTIVYDLNFETPADEYAYEVKQYESYLELIPVAIEVKKPGKNTIKFSETYVKKGKFFREKADEAAEAGRWEEALVVIRDATIEIRRGLRLLGVSM